MSESTLPGRPVAKEAETKVFSQQVPGRLGALLTARTMVPVWLTVILLLAAAFRLTGVNWDEGQHLHPDERFLSQVVEHMQWPQEDFFKHYFDEANSTLNPRNVGHGFFVYGDFPLIFSKGVMVLMDRFVPRDDGVSWQSYGYNNLVGRVIDAFFDLGTVLMLFLLARRLYRDHRIALLAALLYSGTALAIQQAHFFVVDSFTAFFVTVALYFMVRTFQEGRLIDYLLAGAFIGISLATKLSIFTLALVIVVVAGYRFLIEMEERGIEWALERVLVRLALAGLAALVTVRIFQPYAFSGLFSIAERWWANAQEARAWVSGERDAPFAHQWANRTILWFPWKNMVLWGMGLPLGLTAWAGWGSALWQMVRRRNWVHLVPVTWIALLFLHQGTQWVKSMRYFLPIYPALVMMAAWLLVMLWDRAREGRSEVLASHGLFAWTPRKAGLLLALVPLATLIYAFGFTSIYTRPHTRVDASRWIYENLPPGTLISNETVWDDALPLSLPGQPFPWDHFNAKLPVPPDVDLQSVSEEEKKAYLDSLTTTLNITDEDEPAKWYGRPLPSGLVTPGILDKLDQIEYYVISSNRQYDSMSRLPMRFPAVINFYDALFSGELGFERVKEFTSYPHFLGIPLPDQGAEEAWHVYDHNRVQIFRKTDAYSREKAEALILGDVEWEDVRRLWAKDAAGWKGNLKFDRADRALYERGGTWSHIFDRGSFQNGLPLPVWILLVEFVGLLGLPYLLRVARGLPERGYTLAKPLGLLLVGWLTWILASVRLLTFSTGAIALAMLLVALVGLLLAWPPGNGQSVTERLRAWWQQDRHLFLLAEAAFWLPFLLVLAVRWANPDLWYDPLGGEKPMDFSYLNATIKSVYFPPMDPWFAGGYINYYYFGFVLVAVLIKFSGIVPEVAYNLAIPTLFGMLAAGTWGVALSLLVPLHQSRPVRWRWALSFATLALLFVTILGNLGELKVLLDSLHQLSPWSFTSGIPGLELLVKSVHGLWRMVSEGLTLPGRMEWPYWNPTRTIKDTINEFPWFTFLYADLHAHMMALPYTLLVTGLSMAVLRAPRQERSITEGVRLLLLALALGMLWPTNTWDFPTYALVAFAGLGLREWGREGRITLRGLLAVAWRWLLLLLLGRLLFQPFHANFASAYSSVERWQGEQSTLGAFLIVHGLFLFSIAFALVNDFAFGRGHNGAVRSVRFFLRHFGRRERSATLYRRLVRPSLASMGLFYGTFVLGVISLFMLLAGWVVPALTLLLLAVALQLFFRARPAPLWQMALFFIMVGLGLAMAVELVVLKGDIGRMNTVFKFYLQIWVLWGLAAAIGAARIAEQLPRWMPEWRLVWRTGFALLFSIALLYPIFATHARINDRFDRSVGPTLDGMAFLNRAIYHHQGQQIELHWDGEAIRWMQENLPGSPTIVEMNPYNNYTWSNRFAMFTGNPTIIGWDWHQRQQRAAANAEEVPRRIVDVQSIYNTPDSQLAHDILLRYGADYIIVGAFERAYATPEGIAKFEPYRGKLWDLVYENPEVKIYRVIKPELADGT